MKIKTVLALIMTVAVMTFTACGVKDGVAEASYEEVHAETTDENGTESSQTGSETKSAVLTADGLEAEDLFSDRDLEQTADLSLAERINVSGQEDITIDSAGVYVLSGESEETTIYIEAGD